MDRLRECPWCKVTPIMFGNGTIECLNDECKIQPALYYDDHPDEPCEDMDGQIKIWNTRATDPLMEKMAAALDVAWEYAYMLNDEDRLVILRAMNKYREATCQQEKK